MKAMNLLYTKRLALLIVLCVGTTLALSAQDMKQASELYNSAVNGYKTDPAKAVADLEKSISITKSVEDAEAGKLQKSAYLLLSKAHFQLAQRQYKQKNLDACVTSMERARDLADSLGDKKFAQQINRSIPGIYYGAGLKNQEAGKFEEALKLYKRATEANPRFLDPYIAAANMQDSLKQYDEMIETLRDGMQAATEANNLIRATDMKVMALNFLKLQGNTQQEAKQYAEAVKTFEKALTFDEKDSEVYFALAVCHQSTKEHEKALENAKLSLEHAVLTTDKVPIYFLQAQELQALGRNDEACAMYKKAAEGTFKDAAEHQMKEVLKCQ